MKKLLCIVTAAALFTACSKSSTTPATSPSTTTPVIPTDGWTLNGTAYKQKYGMRQTGQVCITGLDANSPVNSFAAFFKTYPTASGTYHIVALVPDSTMSYPGQKIGPNDIVISGAIPNGNTTGNKYKTMWSMGSEGKDATVTVTNGKIKVEVPEIAITSFNNDTSKITGTIIED